jgi:hypothetical protein
MTKRIASTEIVTINSIKVNPSDPFFLIFLSLLSRNYQFPLMAILVPGNGFLRNKGDFVPLNFPHAILNIGDN